ncbi:TIGR02269 family lipoprotein [Corallococcus sp. Z5C101001]|uniref:SitA6 family polymorphic toxin lipoprotein n=1 Tax=Corallococcus sp. Z5C101001 TaxID=2596829 RepID=UPI0011813681|nr:TIGR02269 family lipoprotein [Corallococcus sp. Z5C101001]TSC23091.1 TIGR02269 family lipoprotein [Corallococcus sp. Z5C101001]
MGKSLTSVVLALGMAACASSTPLQQRWDEAEAECGDASEDACVTLVCGDTACGFYRCEDVAGEVVLARGLPPRPPPVAVAPAPGSGPRRNWGGSMDLPGGAEPVMVFPWYGSAKPVPPQRQLPAGRFEKHHIFPQAQDLARWFKARGIDIHQYTIPIPVHVHRRIHGGGPKGGLWNEAWREFSKANRSATPPEIFKHAGELIYRFQLLGGPIQQYN